MQPKYIFEYTLTSEDKTTKIPLQTTEWTPPPNSTGKKQWYQSQQLLPDDELIARGILRAESKSPNPVTFKPHGRNHVIFEGGPDSPSIVYTSPEPSAESRKRISYLFDPTNEGKKPIYFPDQHVINIRPSIPELNRYTIQIKRINEP